jgi:uncharacterized protein
LVNNAGSGLCGPAESLDTAQLEAMIQLNVGALSSMCTLVGAAMVRQGYGSILNVGSFAGFNPAPYFAAYNGSKSFVLPYSLALRAELAPKGVRVCCILPGFVATSFEQSAGITSEAYQRFSAKNSMTPAQVAKAGLRCVGRNQAWRVAGLTNKLARFVMGVLPRAWVPVMMRGVLEPLLFGGKK